MAIQAKELFLILLCLIFNHLPATESAATEMLVQEGNNVTLNLPGYSKCGQYILLDPSLELVVIVSGANSTTTFGGYIRRAKIKPSTSGSGFDLTISSITKDDEGTYKLAVSFQPGCKGVAFDVMVLSAAEEYLGAWSQWSGCLFDCDPTGYRQRERNCSVPGGCAGLGDLLDEDTCDRAQHCPHWTEWGQYGPCSAKCGKGFKIRKRICIDKSDTLRETSACFGPSTENNMCMVICDVVGVWSDWSDWNNCTGPCLSGNRFRTRTCGGDPRATILDCPGSGNETERCLPVNCSRMSTSSTATSPFAVTNTSSRLPAYITISNDVTLNYYVLLAMGCLVLIIIVLIVVCVMRKRTMRRNSERDIRAVRGIKKAKHSIKDANQPRTGSNVYSEMNSSVNDVNNINVNQGVNVMDLNDPPRSPRLPTTSMILRDLESEIMNDSFIDDDPDSDFDTIDDSRRPSQCDRQENVIIMPEKRSFTISSETAMTQNVSNVPVRRGSSIRRPSDVQRAKKVVKFDDQLCFDTETWAKDQVNGVNGGGSNNGNVVLETVEEVVGSQEYVESENRKENKIQSKTEGVLMVNLNSVKPQVFSDSKLKRISNDIQEVMENIGYPEETVYANTEIVGGKMKIADESKDKKGLKKQESFYNTPVVTLCNCPRETKPPKLTPSNSTSSIRDMKEKEAMEELQLKQQQEQLQELQLQQQQLELQLKFNRKKELEGESVYYNQNICPDESQFYVTPRRKRSLMFFKKNSDEEPIYDVPRFSDS